MTLTKLTVAHSNHFVLRHIVQTQYVFILVSQSLHQRNLFPNTAFTDLLPFTVDGLDYKPHDISLHRQRSCWLSMMEIIVYTSGGSEGIYLGLQSKQRNQE